MPRHARDGQSSADRASKSGKEAAAHPMAEPPYDEEVYGRNCRLDAEQRRRLAHEVRIRNFGEMMFYAGFFVLALLMSIFMSGHLELISTSSQLICTLFAVFFTMTGVALAGLRPWAGKAAFAWAIVSLGGVLSVQIFEGEVHAWSLLVCVAVPWAVGWLTLGALGRSILVPGYRRLSDHHPYWYKKRRYRTCFEPLSMRMVWTSLVLLVITFGSVAACRIAMNDKIQLYSPPIESDWLKRDGENGTPSSRP